MTEKEKMLAGELYNAGNTELKQDRIRARRLFYEYNKTDPSETELRNTIIRKLINAEGSFEIETAFLL